MFGRGWIESSEKMSTHKHGRRVALPELDFPEEDLCRALGDIATDCRVGGGRRQDGGV